MTANASKVGEYHPWTTYVYAREEARRRGDGCVGTEHLVLGLLREPDLAQETYSYFAVPFNGQARG
jgi:hypothetical protein